MRKVIKAERSEQAEMTLLTMDDGSVEGMLNLSFLESGRLEKFLELYPRDAQERTDDVRASASDWEVIYEK